MRARLAGGQARDIAAPRPERVIDVTDFDEFEQADAPAARATRAGGDDDDDQYDRSDDQYDRNDDQHDRNDAHASDAGDADAGVINVSIASDGGTINGDESRDSENGARDARNIGAAATPQRAPSEAGDAAEPGSGATDARTAAQHSALAAPVSTAPCGHSAHNSKCKECKRRRAKAQRDEELARRQAKAASRSRPAH